MRLRAFQRRLRRGSGPEAAREGRRPRAVRVEALRDGAGFVLVLDPRRRRAALREIRRLASRSRCRLVVRWYATALARRRGLRAPDPFPRRTPSGGRP
jgi:hypothetical protein